MTAHQVQGRLFRIGTTGPVELLLDVTSDPMSVYEAGRDAVRALHADQELDPGITERMVARMGHLVDSPPPAPGEEQTPHVVINKPSMLMWAVV